MRAASASLMDPVSFSAEFTFGSGGGRENSLEESKTAKKPVPTLARPAPRFPGSRFACLAHLPWHDLSRSQALGLARHYLHAR